MGKVNEMVNIVIPEIEPLDVPNNFDQELDLASIRCLLPYGDRELLIHAVGRTKTKPVRWAGLFKVPFYMTVDHFNILPGKQFPEILSQAGIVASMLEYDWDCLRMVLATEMWWKVAPIPDGEKAVQIKTNDVVMVIIDQLLVNSMSAPNNPARRVVLELYGRIFVGDRLVVDAKAFGEGMVLANKWVNQLAKTKEKMVA